MRRIFWGPFGTVWHRYCRYFPWSDRVVIGTRPGWLPENWDVSVWLPGTRRRWTDDAGSGLRRFRRSSRLRPSERQSSFHLGHASGSGCREPAGLSRLQARCPRAWHHRAKSGVRAMPGDTGRSSLPVPVIPCFRRKRWGGEGAFRVVWPNPAELVTAHASATRTMHRSSITRCTRQKKRRRVFVCASRHVSSAVSSC